MDNNKESSSSYLSFTVVVGLLIVVCTVTLKYILKVLRGLNDEEPQNAPDVKSESSGDHRTAKASQAPKKKKKQNWSSQNDNKSFSHMWLLTSLKGHSGQILDMDLSSNGKYLVSCADDRTVMVWDIKQLKQSSNKSLRINVEFDHATSSKFSPDSKALIINKYTANAIEIYKLEKNKDKKGWLTNGHKSITFAKVHNIDVLNIAIACNGKFIMSSSVNSDVVIFDLKGQKLGHIDTKFGNNFCAKISTCGRFFAVSGSAKDVLIYEVNFTISGEYQNIKEAFKLKHESEVFDIAFDADTSHIATVSKDGKWSLFDTKIDYKHGDLPQLRKHGKFRPVANSTAQPKVALSPNAEVLVVAAGDTVSFYATDDCHLDSQIDGLVTGDGAVKCLAFDSDGSHLFVAADNTIRVFHNVPGYRCAIESAREKLKQNQTSATRERLKQLIIDFERTVKSIDEN